MSSSPQKMLAGLVVAVEAGLPSDSAPLAATLKSMGARVHNGRRGDASEVTHLVWQDGRNPELYNQCAVNDGCEIVSPLWIQMCREQGARMDVDAFRTTADPTFGSIADTKKKKRAARSMEVRRGKRAAGGAGGARPYRRGAGRAGVGRRGALRVKRPLLPPPTESLRLRALLSANAVSGSPRLTTVTHTL